MAEFASRLKIDDKVQTPLPKPSSSVSSVQPFCKTKTKAMLDNRDKCIRRIRTKHVTSLKKFIHQSAITESNPLLMVDPSYHGNFGDALLTMGQYVLARRLRGDDLLILNGADNRQKAAPYVRECNYAQGKKGNITQCKLLLERQAMSSNIPHRFAMWQAGGNWGDLYRFIQTQRVGSLSNLLYSNYTVIGMPQSLYYANKTLEKEDALTMKRGIYNGLGFQSSKAMVTQQGEMENIPEDDKAWEQAWEHARARVVWTWRETKSFEKAKELYPFATNLLLPDIAFQTGPYWDGLDLLPPPDLEVDILFFLRQDQESRFKTYNKDKNGVLRTVLDRAQESSGSSVRRLTYRVVDWKSREHLDGLNRDPLSIESAVQLVKLGKVLICDRLHAAITAYLAGVPFVYMDQMTGKISSTFAVAFNSSGLDHDCLNESKHLWAKAADIESAVSLALQMLC